MIMKKILLTFCLISALAHSLRAEEDIVKKGLNFGPLPALAYDADKGFQYGAILQIYDFGDGSLYPNFKSYWYLESSWFTKGSQLYTIMNDTKGLIPGIRICSTLQAQVEGSAPWHEDPADTRCSWHAVGPWSSCRGAEPSTCAA